MQVPCGRCIGLMRQRWMRVRRGRTVDVLVEGPPHPCLTWLALGCRGAYMADEVGLCGICRQAVGKPVEGPLCSCHARLVLVCHVADTVGQVADKAY